MPAPPQKSPENPPSTKMDPSPFFVKSGAHKIAFPAVALLSDYPFPLTLSKVVFPDRFHEDD